MTRDNVVGFWFGIGAGLVIGYMMKPPDEAVSPGQHTQTGDDRSVTGNASPPQVSTPSAPATNGAQKERQTAA